MKGLPCGIMHMAQFKGHREIKSCLLQWEASSKFEEMPIIMSIFSLGRDAWNLMERTNHEAG